MQSNVQVVDRSVQQTNIWLDELADILETPNRQTAYQALRSVLMNLRDRIGTDNAAHLGAQLPLLVRGIFYEDFHPAATPTRERTRAAFLDKIARSIPEGSDLDPEQATRAVLQVLAQHVTPDEVAKLATLFPAEFADLWPEQLRNAPRH